MRFGVLGPLAVWTDDGRPVPIPEVKVRALLADLLTHEGRPVPPDRLIEDLWADRLPRNPGATLQTRVSQLRRALEAAEPGARDLVVWQPAGYSLALPPESLDSSQFRTLTTQGRDTAAASTRTALLTDALKLWRGRAYADFADQEFARPMAVRLDEEQVTALGDHAQARLDLGEHQALASELADLTAQHPYCERLRAVHLQALYRSGRQREALTAYEDLRAHLAEELGVDPSPELSALHQAILTQDPVLRPAPATPSTNLPATLTPLIGRTQQLTQLHNLLASERLITVTGPGGIGKTALALEAARTTDPAQYSDGIWLVDLASPESVDNLIAQAQVTPSKRMLLVLDTCEHVIDEAALAAEALLKATPGLQILATSQEPLGLPGERLLTVPPLEEAVDLFLTRADLELTHENAATITEICRRLDNLPLAIELAAARVRTLGLAKLRDRLDDRFAVLAAGRRGGPPRQQTLRATYDRTWNLLTPEEQSVLRLLATYPNGFPPDDVMTRLVDRSLVIMTDTSDGPQYCLLESMRAYCARVQNAESSGHKK
ncbi:hypothetical protein GCM10009789_71570 [Kribbella sancticallisti]|uniref:OmpR/PhoB-type domain-containing protein n=1 Tax=Kribbella sancticallisti TaxID=460087 RepID=A0ABP4QBP3_9ACTN